MEIVPYQKAWYSIGTVFFIQSTMKNFLTYFFVTLGVIFFVVLWGLAYVWFADPFNVRPLISLMTADSEVAGEVEQQARPIGDSSETSPTDKNSKLSPEQESALKAIGVNPESLPSTLTPEMEACFVATLGQARVAEIKGGESPTPQEVFASRSCYE